MYYRLSGAWCVLERCVRGPILIGRRLVLTGEVFFWTCCLGFA